MPMNERGELACNRCAAVMLNAEFTAGLRAAAVEQGDIGVFPPTSWGEDVCPNCRTLIQSCGAAFEMLAEDVKKLATSYLPELRFTGRGELADHIEQLVRNAESVAEEADDLRADWELRR